MTAGKFVHKKLLIDQIQQAVFAQESVFFSILTETKRSVLLRFSMGKLVHSYCRSRDVTHTIEAINECQQLKFTRSSGQAKDAPEIMQADVFLKSISSGMTDSVPVPDLVDVYSFVTTAEPEVAAVTEELRAQFIEIARDYIGLVADMLVVDICNQPHPPHVLVEQIAKAMPAKAQADDFRARALALVASG